MRYLGWGIGLRYSVTDDSGNVGNGFLINNTFTVNSRNNQPFRGGEITVSVIVLIGNQIIATETINTSCEDPVYQGDRIGSFMVLAGRSLRGGSICCAQSTEDNLPPQITDCPADINIQVGNNCTRSVDWDEPYATDECGVASFTSSYQPGDEFPLGTTRVTYTARDNAGNESICAFNVTVSDNSKPVFTTCNKSKIKVDTDGACNASVSWTPPMARDNCGMASLTSNFSPGDIFPIGKTTVTYTSTDNSGNTATCSFDVQVKVRESEAISGCLNDIRVSAGAACGRQVTWQVPQAACSLSLTSNYEPGEIFPIGTTEVVYTAFDEDENIATCSFTITVIDETAPVFSNCPDDIYIERNEGCEVTASWQIPDLTDNCDEDIMVEASHDPGDVFPLGVTEVTYSAEDNSGLTATCKFKVVVSEVPVLNTNNCPKNITVSANNECEKSVSWEAPVLVNTCTDFTLTSNYQPGDVFAIGTTEVTYTAKDDVGNLSTCSFNVIVENAIKPSISKCPTTIKVKANSEGVAKVEWEVPQAIISCGSAELTSSHEPGDIFEIGTTEVVYTLNNDFDETVSCSFQVIVVEEEFKLEVQKIVTPNNDNYNDEWIIEGISRFKSVHIRIIDRWGSEVFKATASNNGQVIWDGTYRGDIVPSGTYYYLIKLDSESSTFEQKGFLELIK
ncbi:hypothetical protein GCM10011506_20540 [Marivirga lumbricoides]|uniref:HYR domain-containing protein n=1 Tax=Marivirga lumbricoides TaxID=1046115 RepID=A0ABQ1M8X4_9BACT|nr:hypothetical protein GCM10011506_20540 [Marivirga lumbricoides]